MKGQPQLDRTKVVLRHLPPSISKSALLGPIDSVFSGRYTLVSFRPGKNSQKHSFSRAYLDFKRPEDVIEFAEFFEGHVFVNEKGIQFKTTVEYAPSQRVPKQWSKKDGREGTINKDPEYLEFLEFLAKPAENLPSAEIQLERREAERAGAVKETPIVTPLMDFVRQKRVAKGGSRRSLSNGKLSRKGVGSSAGGLYSALSKRGTDRRRNSTKMYVLKDAMKNTTVGDKSKYIRVAKRDILSSTTGAEVLEESGKKKVLLMTGNERVMSHASTNISQHQNAASTKTIVGSSSFEQNQRCKSSSGRIIKRIQYHYSPVYSDMQIQGPIMEKDKRNFRRGQLVLKETNVAPDCKVIGSDMHGICGEKKEKRTRNRDRPERGVWAPHHHPDGSFAKDETLLATTRPFDTLQGDRKLETTNARSGEVKIFGSGFSSPSSLDNGFHKHLACRGSTNNLKDAVGSLVVSVGRNSKRGGLSGCGSHEKQVWVQKSSSGS